ncbi:serine phosphatase RsbU (regulator of sigma subunit) [Actinoplanes lutulentus]|uniref:Serine phosphatase RsbU (Regulator of sigma subunit) n=1 Tax=Actinoplanes lutulentus TaxID=1287878 RepID=A0A327ZE04_9ACTN|nr:PP2C family protein-serine/threonine phosphatase [Actinoplanes lutulentus]MBB2942792.1 serine phosphatase RsbU (regulator of sigma subunit) [Actinoplanes lutulentus]RAK38372.1 serine phosphatase RsbU (regulator of sigma subunit) [Actinoplanes lutulentus]
MSDQPVPLGVLLRAAPPDRLPEVTAEHLRRHFAAEASEVFLADLTLTRLCPLIGSDASDPAAMRCLGSQQVAVELSAGGATRMHLPLNSWGERLGVLRLDLPARPEPELAEQLAAIADELAIALRAADTSTDRYRRAQRQARLTMAAELQWELLPGRSLGDERFLVAGQLQPAYDVHGDHFDWALDGDRLTITVLNGSGDGMEAALLTTVAVNAMRNARRCGADVVEQAELASDAVHALRGGAEHVATLLLEIDLVSGQVAAVDAGSPRCMIARQGEVEPVALEQQLPFGMFAEAHYEIQRFRLEPGDRMLVVSDGVHAAVPGGRSPFGESALLNAIRRTRLQPATEAVGTVMRGLHDYHAGIDPEDDAVTVCLDWRR